MAADTHSMDDTLLSGSVMSATQLEQQTKFDGTINGGFDFLTDIAHQMQARIDLVERIGLHCTCIEFKTYEVTHEFVQHIKHLQAKREALLKHADRDDDDEISLSVIPQLNAFDKEIQVMESQHEEKLFAFKKDKLEQQERLEDCVQLLDQDFLRLNTIYRNLKKEIDEDKAIYPDEFTSKYSHRVEKIDTFITNFGKLQLTGWKTHNSETNLAEILQENGLMVTKSGMLYTRSGNHLTFSEAQDKGYLKNLDVPLQRIFDISGVPAIKSVPSPSSSNLSMSVSKGSSSCSGMSSEDVKYLKTVVGKPLTLALAEITAKQPKDPIHYLGHYLFKYRYNQEIEQVQKEEVEALAHERKVLSKQRWDQFVLEEARAAVVDMVLRAEMEAYQNELKRIEEEAAASEAEEVEEDEQYTDEARDKFV